MYDKIICLHYLRFFAQTICMSMTFILFGVTLILIIFGVIRLQGFGALASILFGVIFLLMGYFCGNISTSLIYFNLLHVLALVLFLIVFFDRRIFDNFHVTLLMVFVEAIVLYFDRGYLLFYTGLLYFMLTAVLFVIYNARGKLLVSNLSLFSIFYVIVDGVFQYFEMRYIFLDFDFVFLVLFFLYVLGKVFSYIDSGKFIYGGIKYGK